MALKPTDLVLVLLAVLAAASGCAHPALPSGMSLLPATEVGPLENPLFVSSRDHEFVWNQVIDELDDYFRIAREDRVRVVGGVATEGRIDTYPVTGATLLEPWRIDATPGFERLQSTLQSIRRRAAVRVTPLAEGYAIEVAVFKELEDVSRPENATVAGVSLRHDGSLVRVTPDPEAGPPTLGWIPLGRDATLEQQIIGNLRARLSDQPDVARLPAVSL